PERPALARQAAGTRPSRALPYALSARAGVGNEGIVLHMSNTGAAGAVLHVYDRLRLEQGPRRYTIEAGKQLQASWPVMGNDGRYDLWLLGPNGFHRHVAGRLHADAEPLSVEAICDPAGPTLRLKLHNPGALSRGFQIEANAYHYAGHHEPALAPGVGATLAWNLAASGGWYDFSVRADDAPGFIRRFAGRIETGAPSSSDPAMGQELILRWTPPA
ncbi:phospholipase domain-containing protein, partial [Achromobacter pulmonis]|uniref:phospholipase domain-containing protein n=1 Tax=Achromobacter pulmonis TaxID=1389932 RepID=UPI003C740100